MLDEAATASKQVMEIRVHFLRRYSFSPQFFYLYFFCSFLSSIAYYRQKAEWKFLAELSIPSLAYQQPRSLAPGSGRLRDSGTVRTFSMHQNSNLAPRLGG